MNTAIITGASVGIGKAAAARFIADGYSVYNLSRRSCDVDGVNNIACDLSDETSIAAALDALARLSPTVARLTDRGEYGEAHRGSVIAACVVCELVDVVGERVLRVRTLVQLGEHVAADLE